MPLLKRQGLLADVRAERTATAGSVILVSRFAATAVLNYVVGLALAWLLTPDAFGLVSAVQNVLLLAAGLLTAGLPWALALRIAQTHGVPSASRPEFRTCLVVNFGFGLALGAAFLGTQFFAVELVPTHALILKEASYPAVQYVPRSDANMELLQRTERTTHCPYKGDASYYSVVADGKTLENSIWTYETPFPAMTEISGHLAFYPDKLKIEEVA